MIAPRMIRLIAVGKLKEEFWRRGMSVYESKLGKYAVLNIVELADEQTPETLSEAEEAQVREREGERIIGALPVDAAIVALAINGRMLTSNHFSKQMVRLGEEGRREVVFIIGGSLGLSEAVLRRAHVHVSFGPMTYPHQLMRLVLLEQWLRMYDSTKHTNA